MRLLKTWCYIGALLLASSYALSSVTGLQTAVCIALALLAVLAMTLAQRMPATHWLHLDRHGRRADTARDMLIGARAGMLILSQALQA
jgi:hypothetical protein